MGAGCAGVAVAGTGTGEAAAFEGLGEWCQGAGV